MFDDRPVCIDLYACASGSWVGAWALRALGGLPDAGTGVR